MDIIDLLYDVSIFLHEKGIKTLFAYSREKPTFIRIFITPKQTLDIKDLENTMKPMYPKIVKISDVYGYATYDIFFMKN